MRLTDFNDLTNRIIKLENCKLIIEPYNDFDGYSGIRLTKEDRKPFTKLDSMKNKVFKIDDIQVIILL